MTIPLDSGSSSAVVPRRLESWKEVAAYLNRTVRTVQRWEREQGLPIHRLHHNRLGSVYAYAHEIDQWWEQRRTALDDDAEHNAPEPAVLTAERDNVASGIQARAVTPFAVLAVLISAAIGAAWINAGPWASADAVKSIAVLPLVTSSQQMDQFIADGVVDDLARHIARLRDVRVVARVPSSRAARAMTDGRELAARLDVDALLRGTVTGTAAAFRIRLELVHPSGRIIWTGQYHGRAKEAGTRNAAALLARDLFASVWPDQALPANASRPNEAYLAYLQGRYDLSKRSPDAVRAAERLFTEAIRLDPAYSEAHAGLADAWLIMGIFGLADRTDALARAKATAEHALALDPSSAEAHTSLAFATELLERKWAEAEAHFREAIALNPSYVPAHHWYALLLDSTLRGDEAIREIETALALDPFSTLLASDLGMVLYHQKQYDRAIAQFTKVLSVDPGYADAHKELGQAYLHSGRFDLALESFERARELGTNANEIEVSKAMTYALSGRKTEARKIMARLVIAPDDPRAGEFLLALGEYDRALDLLLRAKPHGDENLLVGRLFDPVRSDLRYHELMRRSGFTDAGVP